MLLNFAFKFNLRSYIVDGTKMQQTTEEMGAGSYFGEDTLLGNTGKAKVGPARYCPPRQPIGRIWYIASRAAR